MVKNIIANLFGRFWSVLSTFLFVPIYIHYLGFEGYSVISFTLVLMGFMAFLDAGLTGTLSREMALVNYDNHEKSNVLKTLESVYFLIVLLLSICLILGAPVIVNNWINLEELDPVIVTYLLRIVGVELAFQMLFKFYIGGFLGLEKHVKANVIQILWGVFRNGVVIFVIMFWPSLEWFFYTQLISTVVFTIICRFILVKEISGNYTFDKSVAFSKTILKRVSKFAGGILLIAVVAAINSQLDKLVISKMLSIEVLGLYTLAITLSMGIIVAVNPISMAFLPRITALISEEKKDEAQQMFLMVNKFSAVLVFTLASLLAFFPEPILWLWTNDAELAANAAPFLPILAVGYAMLGLQVMPFNVAIGHGNTRINNILGITSLLITIPGYLLMTSRYGAMGAAIIYSSVQFVLTILFYIMINRKYLGENIYKLFSSSVILPGLLVFGLAFLIYQANLMDGSRLMLFIKLAVLSIVMLVAGAKLFLGKELNQFLSRIINTSNR